MDFTQITNGKKNFAVRPFLYIQPYKCT